MFVSQSLKYQLVSVSYIQGDELVVSYRGVSYKKKKCVIPSMSYLLRYKTKYVWKP